MKLEYWSTNHGSFSAKTSYCVSVIPVARRTDMANGLRAGILVWRFLLLKILKTEYLERKSCFARNNMLCIRTECIKKKHSMMCIAVFQHKLKNTINKYWKREHLKNQRLFSTESPYYISNTPDVRRTGITNHCEKGFVWVTNFFQKQGSMNISYEKQRLLSVESS